MSTTVGKVVLIRKRSEDNYYGMEHLVNSKVASEAPLKGEGEGGKSSGMFSWPRIWFLIYTSWEPKTDF